jgi:hypothetical protein
VRIARDPSAADWVTAGTRTLQSRAAGFVPAAFPSYARILHSVGLDSPSTWNSVAAESGATVTAEVQWSDVVDPQEVHLVQSPRRGSLSLREAESLSSALEAFTITPHDCFFGLWEGWARLRVPDAPTFTSSSRVMTLWEGPLADAALSFEAPPGQRVANLWWPRDHAWFVVSEIDFDSTIVAGSPSCIDAVIGRPDLEAFAIAGELDLTSPH